MEKMKIKEINIQKIYKNESQPYKTITKHKKNKTDLIDIEALRYRGTLDRYNLKETNFRGKKEVIVDVATIS